MRDAAQKQHRRNVCSVDAYSEVQAKLAAVAGLECSDYFSARDSLAGRQRRENRFVAREDAAGMRDRQHVLVDHKSGEVHDAIRGSIDRATCRDVDAAMPGRVRRRRRDERAEDLVRPAYRPRPAGLGCRGGCGGGEGGRGEDGEHEPDEKCAAKHPFIVAAGGALPAHELRTAHNHPEMRPVGERCYSFPSIRRNPADYACPQFRQCCLNGMECTHPLSPFDSLMSLSRWRGRVRTPGFAPNGADNN
jgi:hypothetical protein